MHHRQLTVEALSTCYRDLLPRWGSFRNLWNRLRRRLLQLQLVILLILLIPCWVKDGIRWQKSCWWWSVFKILHLLQMLSKLFPRLLSSFFLCFVLFVLKSVCIIWFKLTFNWSTFIRPFTLAFCKIVCKPICVDWLVTNLRSALGEIKAHGYVQVTMNVALFTFPVIQFHVLNKDIVWSLSVEQ